MTKVMRDKDLNTVIRGGSLLEAVEQPIKDGEYMEEELAAGKMMEEYRNQERLKREQAEKSKE